MFEAPIHILTQEERRRKQKRIIHTKFIALLHIGFCSKLRFNLMNAKWTKLALAKEKRFSSDSIRKFNLSMCLSIWRGERENSRKWVFFNSAFASVSFSKFPSTIFRSCANGPTVVNRKCVYLCVWWPFFPFAIRSYHFHHPFLSHLYISLSLSAFHSLVSFECLIIFA